MKRLLTLFLFSTALTVHAQAPHTARQGTSEPAPVDPARAAKVQKLFAAMHVERTMDEMMGMMQQMVLQSTKNMAGMDAMTPAQEKLVHDYQDKSMHLAEESVGWKAMEPEYTRIYAATFTDAEIDAMTAFYSSPAGQAMVDKTPQISQQTLQVVQGKIAALQPQLRKMAEDLGEQLKATSPTTAKPAPSGSK